MRAAAAIRNAPSQQIAGRKLLLMAGLLFLIDERRACALVFACGTICAFPRLLPFSDDVLGFKTARVCLPPQESLCVFITVSSVNLITLCVS